MCCSLVFQLSFSMCCSLVFQLSLTVYCNLVFQLSLTVYCNLVFQLYAGDENLMATEMDYKKALDLLLYIDQVCVQWECTRVHVYRFVSV